MKIAEQELNPLLPSATMPQSEVQIRILRIFQLKNHNSFFYLEASYACLAIAINKKRVGIWATLIGGGGWSACNENYRIRTKARKSARAAGVSAAAAPAPPLQLHSCTVALFCSFYALSAAT